MKFMWTDKTDSTVYNQALSIRKEVFIKEQQVPEELEIDELESQAEHVVLFAEDQPIGTARILEKEPALYKIQRVAILKPQRGKGLGFALMQEAEHHIRRLGGSKMILDAQLHAIPFYESLGFSPQGKEFLDAGIPHRRMTKTLA